MSVVTDKTLKDLINSVGGIDVTDLMKDTTGLSIVNELRRLTSVVVTSALSNLSDVLINTPVDGQILKYDITRQKWINVDNNTLHNYNYVEQKVGTWVNGSDIFERTIHINASIPLDQYTPIVRGESIELIGVDSMGSYFIVASGQRWSTFASYTSGGFLIYQEPNKDIMILNNSGQVFTDGFITIRYIKV